MSRGLLPGRARRRGCGGWAMGRLRLQGSQGRGIVGVLLCECEVGGK
jgi:hypothetical protein